MYAHVIIGLQAAGVFVSVVGALILALVSAVAGVKTLYGMIKGVDKKG